MREIIRVGETLSARKENLVTSRWEVAGILDSHMNGAYSKAKIEALGLQEMRESRRARLVIKEAAVMYGRVVEGESRGQCEAERYYRRWKYLKQCRIPTIPSMRILDEDKILMGDMTCDGSGFVGKVTYWDDDSPTIPLADFERVFLRIDLDAVKAKIAKVQSLAWENGLLLPDDEEEFAVWIHPDGTWQVVVMDLTYLGRRRDESRQVLLDTRRELFNRVDWIYRVLRRREEWEAEHRV